MVCTTARARADFDGIIEKAAGGERVIIKRGNKPLAVVIPFDDLRLLESLLEDNHDLAMVAERRDEAVISQAEMKRRLKVK